MGNSVAVVVAVWGTDYAPFIDRWWESLRQVKRQPEEIVLVAEMHDRSGLHNVPDWVSSRVVKVKTECDHYQQWWSVAVHAATTDYIAQMPIDDQFGPDALNFVDHTDADLIIDRVEFLQGGEWPANWDTKGARSRRFAPGGISPFHRNLLGVWDKIPQDCHWNDFVWYLLLKELDIEIYKTDAVRMIHDLGSNHKTMSGQMLDNDTRTKADAQLARIRSEMKI